MNNDFPEFMIFFKDDPKNNKLFVQSSELVNDTEMRKMFAGSLNLEGIAIFRKTPLTALIDRFIYEFKMKIQNENAKTLISFLTFILLSVVDPGFFKTAKKLKIIKSDFFSNIESFFARDAFGRKYFTKNNLPEEISEDDINNLIDYLMSEKILIKESNRYFIDDDFVLINAKIKNDNESSLSS